MAEHRDEAGEKKPLYIIRIWQNGRVMKQVETAAKKEAAKLWAAWNNVENCGPELLVNGEHIPWARANRILGRQGSMVRQGRSGL